MKILLTNDDGVGAGGLIAIENVLRDEAEVFVVGPRVEQSGVSQKITFLSPLFPHHLKHHDGSVRGYSIDGTPADCVKLGIHHLCPWKPDLVVSGINGGLNAGVNVCYSGTVGGALVASTFDIPAISCSLEFEKEMNFDRAAEILWPIIKKVYDIGIPTRKAVNINVPTAALAGAPELAFVPVELNPLGYGFDQGADPKGRPYYWANNSPDPIPSEFETDTQALKAGKITASVVGYDPNQSEYNSTFASAFEKATT